MTLTLKHLSTQEARYHYRQYLCNTRDWSEIEFLGRAPVRTIKGLEPAYSALEGLLVSMGYGSANNVGSYACRKIHVPGGRASLHSYRLAIDIDPSDNRRVAPGRDPYRGDRAKLTRLQVIALERIHTVDGWQVFTSGSHFRVPDLMHVQIAAPMASIKKGIYMTNAHAGNTAVMWVRHLNDRQLEQLRDAGYWGGELAYWQGIRNRLKQGMALHSDIDQAEHLFVTVDVDFKLRFDK